MPATMCKAVSRVRSRKAKPRPRSSAPAATTCSFRATMNSTTARSSSSPCARPRACRTCAAIIWMRAAPASSTRIACWNIPRLPARCASRSSARPRLPRSLLPRPTVSRTKTATSSTASAATRAARSSTTPCRPPSMRRATRARPTTSCWWRTWGKPARSANGEATPWSPIRPESTSSSTATATRCMSRRCRTRLARTSSSRRRARSSRASDASRSTRLTARRRPRWMRRASTACRLSLSRSGAARMRPSPSWWRSSRARWSRRRSRRSARPRSCCAASATMG